MTQIYHFLADYFAVQWWLKRGTTNKRGCKVNVKVKVIGQRSGKKWVEHIPWGGAAAFAQLTRLQTALSLAAFKSALYEAS